MDATGAADEDRAGAQDGTGGMETTAFPVAGGELAALRWPASAPGAPVVLALHGITANALCWARVAHHLGGRVTLVAPDLRGRAGSAALPGPYGIGAHAEDAAAVAAALGGGPLVLAGHSMGAFTAAVAAVRHPDLFASVLLVDGGVGFPPPPLPAGADPDEVITAVIGPAMRRLSMTFPDRDAYRAFWQGHPAFAASWSPWTDAYVQRDLVGEEPRLHSSCAVEAIRTDGIDLFGAEVLEAAGRLRCPAELLWAERGLLDEPQGLYDEQRLAAAGLDMTTRRLAGSNHYTILLGDEGARLVAERLLAAAGVSGPEFGRA